MIDLSSLLDTALNNRDRFRPDFIDWLKANLHIWSAFKAEANLIWSHGKRHWGARCIGEYLRRETALRENADTDWKISDWRWPDCARLYLLLYPERDGFFEIRESQQRRKAV